MRTVLARAWHYLAAILQHLIDRRVDLRIQLEAATEEARRRHLLLTEQAASVVGNERELGIRVERAFAEIERFRGATAQALLLASKAGAEGDAARAEEHERTAAVFAARLASAEKMAAELVEAKSQAEAAASAARRALEGSAQMLNGKLAEASRLATQIEAARMQERVADALAGIDSLAPRGAAPTLDEIRSRVDRRFSLAAARAELSGSSAGARMLDVERAGLQLEADLKLEEVRQSLALPPPAEAGDAPAEGRDE